MIVDCAIYRHGKRSEEPSDYSDALEAVRHDNDGYLWIDLCEPTAEELELVSEEFGLHPLAVEDAVKAHQRPKLDTYPDSLFMVLKRAGYQPDDHTVTVDEVMIFLGDSYVMTVGHGTTGPLTDVRSALEAQPELLAGGPAAVLHAVCDLIVDDYLRIAAHLQNDLDELETEVFTPGRSVGVAERIYALKRQVVTFRRATGPLEEPLLRLADGAVRYVPEELLPYLRDVADHLSKVNDVVEALDRLLSDILSANLAQVSVQQNDDMRKMSAWAALLAVPTVVAGIYGMNFTDMPELHQPLGYPVALLGMVTVCGLLYRTFKRSGWL